MEDIKEDLKEEIKVEIEKSLLSGFSDDAKEELKSQAIKLTHHLVDETLLKESERRIDKNDKVEITANDVRIAATMPKSPPKKRKLWPIIIQSLSPFFLFFAGKFWNTENETLLFIIIIVVITIMALLIYSLATDQYE